MSRRFDFTAGNAKSETTVAEAAGRRGRQAFRCLSPPRPGPLKNIITMRLSPVSTECFDSAGAKIRLPAATDLASPSTVAYKSVGQPVLIPGDMGRYSYVLVGAEGAMENTFGSTCHGAGRAMSRHKARKIARGRAIDRELEDRGIYVKASSRRTLDEEIPEAYKDVTNVVDACQLAGISKKVAQLRPLGCIKG